MGEIGGAMMTIGRPRRAGRPGPAGTSDRLRRRAVGPAGTGPGSPLPAAFSRLSAAGGAGRLVRNRRGVPHLHLGLAARAAGEIGQAMAVGAEGESAANLEAA